MTPAEDETISFVLQARNRWKTF